MTDGDLARINAYLDAWYERHQPLKRAEQRTLELAQRHQVMRNAAASLANAMRTALRKGDITNDSTTACLNALRQWERLDP